MSKTARLSMLFTFVFLLLVFSCSQQNEQTTITWWSFPTFGNDSSFEKELIEAFEKKYPNITVEFELISFEDGPSKIEAAIASKTGPDFTYDSPGRIISWGNRDLLVPLNDIIEPVKDTLATGPLSASKDEKGNYYMYPIHSGGFTMAFNKNLLEDLGLLEMLPYNREGRVWSLDEYESLLRALKEKLPPGKVPAVFYAKSAAGDQGTRAFMVNLYGDAPLMNNSLTEYTFNSANAIKNAKWLQMAVQDGLMLNGSTLQSGNAIDMYCASTSASTILFSLQLEKINKDKINYNGEYFESIYMPFPNNTEQPVLEFIVGGPCIFDNGDNKKIEAAKKFITFMAQDEVYAPKLINATGLFPVSSNISVNLSTPEEEWNAQAVKYFGAYYNSTPNFATMRQLWYPAMQDILKGLDASIVLNDFTVNANK